MTIEEKLEKLLLSYGVSEEQCAAIVERIKADKTEMEGLWQDAVEDHPMSVLGALWLAAMRHAIEYLTGQ